MVFVNEHYLKLAGGYLFPEIARRVEAFKQTSPEAAKRIIHCGIGDVTEPLPAAAVAAMHKAADELSRRETFRGYPPAAGYDFVRTAIAQGDFKDRGIEIDPAEVFLSDGSKGDCGHILEIFGAGNRIAIGDPVYPVYVDTNVMAGNTGAARPGGGYEGIIYLPCTPQNGFAPAPPREKADLVYLCSPNNPTGSVMQRDQLRAWVDYALHHDAIILYDAAYEAYIRDPDLPRSIYEVDGARSCAIEFHSFSKNGGFTGVRCGYTVCPKDVTAAARDGRRVTLHDLWARRWSTRANGVSYPVQRAAEALYSPEGRRQVDALIEHYLGNARLLREGCESVGWKAYGGQHAPYVWVECPDGLESWAMFDRLLQEANIVVVPGAGFGRCGEGYFRMSAFNTRPNVQEAAARIEALAAGGPGTRRSGSAVGAGKHVRG